MKIAIAFVLGVGVGIAFFFSWREPSVVAPAESIPSVPPIDDGPNPSNRALLQRIAELESQVDALEIGGQSPVENSPLPTEPQPEVRAGASASNITLAQLTEQRFIDEGFTPERAEWIQRRYDELAAALLLPETLERDPLYQLRMEIGDSEYERYLIATRRDPVVWLRRPQPNSQAALFGFQHNDRITSYDGHRVFDHREIRRLDSEGTAGTAVVVDIIRDGQPMQIYIQRGSFDAYLFPGFVPLTDR